VLFRQTDSRRRRPAKINTGRSRASAAAGGHTTRSPSTDAPARLVGLLVGRSGAAPPSTPTRPASHTHRRFPGRSPAHGRRWHVARAQLGGGRGVPEKDIVVWRTTTTSLTRRGECWLPLPRPTASHVQSMARPPAGSVVEAGWHGGHSWRTRLPLMYTCGGAVYGRPVHRQSTVPLLSFVESVLQLCALTFWSECTSSTHSLHQHLDSRPHTSSRLHVQMTSSRMSNQSTAIVNGHFSECSFYRLHCISVVRPTLVNAVQ